MAALHIERGGSAKRCGAPRAMLAAIWASVLPSPLRFRSVASSCGVQGVRGLRPAQVVVFSKGPRRVLAGPYLGQV